MRSTIAVARANRLLAEVGHDDVNEALRHMAQMQSWLKVIQTWCAFPHYTTHAQIRDACIKALDRAGQEGK